MSFEEHKKGARKNLKYGIITVSTSRYNNSSSKVNVPEQVDDLSGEIMWKKVEGGGGKVVFYKIIPDDIGKIKDTLEDALGNNMDVILINGGTGLSKKDLTIETVEKMYEKKIDGFGEIFRYLSFKDIGSPAILSRASGGVIGEKVIFAIPGSPKAAGLAMDELILKEAGHILKHLEEG
jgi:molybdenum cofactor biosynthesis protein B